MLSEETIKHEARLIALENLTMTLLAALVRTPDGMAELITGMLGRMRAETFPGVDPAISDMMAAEIEAAHERLLTGAAEKLEQRKGG